MFDRIVKNLKRFWYLPYSIFFCFYYLPFRQAWKLPVILYKPKLIKLKGTVRIEGPVSTGMVKLGENIVHVYPHSGIAFENNGGEIIFKGKCIVGANSAISVGPKGKLVVGENFAASTSLKCCCWHEIVIGKDCRCGWDVIMMDTSFHRIKDINGQKIGKGYSTIRLGDHTWLATRSMVMPGAETCLHTIVAASSLLNRKYDESYVLLAGAPAIVKKRGVWRDLNDDRMEE